MNIREFWRVGDGDSFWRTRVVIGTLMFLFMVSQVVVGIAHAQTAGTRSTPCDPNTPNNNLCLVITPPTTMVDGTPTVLPMTYRITRALGSGTATTLATAQTATTYYDKGLAPGTYTYVVYVTCSPNCSESAASNSASKAATAPIVTPNPPAIQVVQVVIGMDHAPVFIVLKDGSRSDTIAGFAPIGTPCDGPVLFKYRMKYWRRPVAFKPWGAVTTTRVAAPCA